MAGTIVILHGWGSQLSRWRPLVAALEKKLSVVLPSLPQDKVRPTAAFAEWLNQTTNSLPPFILLGHSFGGQIAINFVARYPHRVKKLILIASAGIRRPSLKARLLLPLAKILKFMPDRLKQLAYRAIRETDYVNAGPMMRETMNLILKEDQQANMVKIKVPTLIIWGETDRYTPLKDGRLTHELIKSSRFILVRGGGHSLPFTHVQFLKEKILWFIK